MFRLQVITLLIVVSFLSATETEGFLDQEDIKLFYKQGFIVKKQCFNQEHMEEVSHDVTAVIEYAFKTLSNQPEQTISDSDQFIHIDGSKVIFKRTSNQPISILRINGVSGMRPALLNTVRSEKLVRTFFALLGTNDIEQLINQLHPKIAGDGVSFPKHQDIQFRKSYDPNWQDILGNGSYAICIIAVDPMNEQNGGLWIDLNNYPEPQGLEENRFWVEAQPGDLLFMHPKVFHGSGPNLSKTKNRRTLLAGFCAFGANHKQYPGTDVNVRLTLSEDNQINIEQLMWNNLQPSAEPNH